ncbi:MAG: outer membrane homotrimeric porin [Desulfovibrio sp.]|nr:outer membrane homotrimeric porin [Desulfovibrio sp.]
MKQAKLLLLSLALILATTGGARADGVDIKVKGEWDFSFGWTGNLGFTHSVHGNAYNAGADAGYAKQRMRFQIDFVISEYLSAVYGIQVGTIDWGRNEANNVGLGSGGAMDSDGVNMGTHLAYLDWLIPSTDIQVRMGIQPVALPSTPMGSSVLDSQVAGIAVSTPLADWIALTAIWMRPYDAYAGDFGSTNANGRNPRFDEMDLFGLVLPIEIEDFGLKITPWFVYGLVGAGSGYYDYLFSGSYENSVGVDYPVDPDDPNSAIKDASSARGSRSSVYWIGTHLEFSLLDPLVFNVEAIYGRLRKTDVTGLGNSDLNLENGYSLGTSGWFLAATLDYTLEIGDGFSMTPGIFGWWSSGDSADAYKNGKLGRMPTLSQYNAGFAPTTFGTAGTFSIGTDSAVTGNGIGTWGVGIQLADITFIEDLTHTLRFAYYKGTNSAEAVRNHGNNSVFSYASSALYLTDKDHVFEVNFDHSYAIYENLTAVLELGWLRLSADGDTWRNEEREDGKTGQNAWKAQLVFNFSF